jgi:hypothetical protein
MDKTQTVKQMLQRGSKSSLNGIGLNLVLASSNARPDSSAIRLL